MDLLRAETLPWEATNDDLSVKVTLAGKPPGNGPGGPLCQGARMPRRGSSRAGSTGRGWLDDGAGLAGDVNTRFTLLW